MTLATAAKPTHPVHLGAVFLAALVVGCGGDGGGGDARQALSQTAAQLGEIRSGALQLRVVVDPRNDGADQVGFELNGPFSLPKDAPAEFRIEYTRLLGEAGAGVTFVVADEKAFVLVGDETYALPDQERRRLLDTGGPFGAGGLERLAVDDWLVDPELSDGDDVAGDETDRIEGRLNVPNATRDLVELAQSLGADDTAVLLAADAERLREAAEEARIEVLTGKEDRLLRRLAVAIELGVDVPDPLRTVLGSVVGATLEVDLTVENPNEPVSVEEPGYARPASELPG